MDIPPSMYPFTGWCLNCFQFWSVMNNAALFVCEEDWKFAIKKCLPQISVIQNAISAQEKGFMCRPEFYGFIMWVPESRPQRNAGQSITVKIGLHWQALQSIKHMIPEYLNLPLKRLKNTMLRKERQWNHIEKAQLKSPKAKEKKKAQKTAVGTQTKGSK